MRSCLALPLVMAFVLSGCASRRAQAIDKSLSVGPTWATAATDVRRVPVLGADVVVRGRQGSRTRGELLAVGDEFLYVVSGDDVVPFPRAEVQNVQINLAYLPQAGNGSAAIGGWGAAGTASTLTHGFFVLYTAPIFAIATVGSAMVLQSKIKPTVGSRDVEFLWQYARFPQGLPPHWQDRIEALAPRPAP